MIDIVTKSGKRIGRISDSLDQDDSIIIDGKELSLSDAYADTKIKDTFNKHVQELKDVISGKNTDTTGTTGTSVQ